MDVTIDSKKLLAALELLKPIAASKTSISILRTIRLTATKHVQYLEACDMETWGKVEINTAAQADPGVVCIDATAFVAAVKAAGGDAIRILDLDKNEVMVQGTGNVTLTGLPPEDYMQWPYKDSANHFITLPCAEMLDAFDWVLPAVSTDETRPVLASLNLNWKDGQVNVVATDSYRLHRATFEPTGTTTLPDGNYLLLRDFAKIVQAYAKKSKVESLIFGFILSGDVPIAVTVADAPNGVSFTSRLRDGQFPRYQQLIPETFDLHAAVGIKAMQEAIDAICKAAGKRDTIPVRLHFFKDADDTKLTLAYDKQDGLKVERTMLAGVEDPNGLLPFEIGVNPGFLREMVKGREHWDCAFLAPLRPMICNPDGDMHKEALLMPIRLEEDYAKRV